MTVNVSGTKVDVQGPKGKLSMELPPTVTATREGESVKVTSSAEGRDASRLQGLGRALLANMVKGVTQGFEKRLTLVGVGYRAQASGDKVNLSLGFSHPVVHVMPKGVKVETPQQTEIVVKGIDKQQVGQVAAEIRAYRPPEPYKGKGVRYVDEQVKLKETKKK